MMPSAAVGSTFEAQHSSDGTGPQGPLSLVAQHEAFRPRTAEECRLQANAYQQRARDVVGYIRWCRETGHAVGRFTLADLALARLECSRYRRLTRQRLAILAHLAGQGVVVGRH